MSRKPNIDPNIYQVDLVAGLFGAFMMVWISGAQNSEYPGDAIAPPTFAVLRVRITVPQSGAIGGIYSASDASASEQECFSDRALQTIGVKDGALDCPTGLPRHVEHPVFNLANFAYWNVPGCQSPAAVQPYDYSYSMQLNLTLPAEWKIRGYSLVQDTSEGVLPGLETGWNDAGGVFTPDPSKSLASYITNQNSELAKINRPVLNCQFEHKPWSEVSIYFIPDEFDIWRKAELTIGFAPKFAGLNVFGNLKSEATTQRLIFDRWTETGISWPQRSIDAALCAYRDGQRVCFKGVDIPFSSTSLVLKRT